MDAGFEAHLRVGEVTFDDADAALLVAVDERGSLNAAADHLGRSYSRVQKRVTALEDELGPLVERRRGGSGGGGSHLTGTARDLLAHFARVQAALADTAETDELVLRGTVTGRDGELATVETGAGTVSALLFDDVDVVHVTIRADAVTLYPPESAPPAIGTSARNRFEGAVARVDREKSIARVAIDVGEGIEVPVLVTHDSLSKLDLSAGDPVVATFKATATRATPA